MDKPSRIEFLPPRPDDDILTVRKGSRLQHEHDQNDAIFARLDFVDKYNAMRKQLEEGAKAGIEKKQLEAAGNAKGNFLRILVWAQILAAIQIIVLKKFGVL